MGGQLSGDASECQYRGREAKLGRRPHHVRAYAPTSRVVRVHEDDGDPVKFEGRQVVFCTCVSALSFRKIWQVQGKRNHPDVVDKQCGQATIEIKLDAAYLIRACAAIDSHVGRLSTHRFVLPAYNQLLRKILSPDFRYWPPI